MASRPQVSVLIPVYNREHLISEALDSVLRQSFRDFEILVIDDGSTDRSAELVYAYSDPRIRVIHNAKNLGIPRTRNRAVEAALGRFIAWMDSDDIAHPERLERQVAFLKAHPRVAAVGSFARWIDATGRAMGVRRRPVSSDEIKARLLFSGCFTNTTVMSRRQAQERYRYREDFDLGSDIELWTRVAQDHEVANLPEVLMDHRTHARRAGGARGERSEIVARNKRRVARAQLEGLGMRFGAADLERHMNLRTAGSIPQDLHYPAWAHEWLLRLGRANRRVGLYPEQEFSRALGEKWFLVCYRGAFRGVGTRPLRSPLTPRGIANYVNRFGESLRRLATRDRGASAAA